MNPAVVGDALRLARSIVRGVRVAAGVAAVAVVVAVAATQCDRHAAVAFTDVDRSLWFDIVPLCHGGGVVKRPVDGVIVHVPGAVCASRTHQRCV